MAKDSNVDELFEVRNAFYLGNYQQVSLNSFYSTICSSKNTNHVFSILAPLLNISRLTMVVNMINIECITEAQKVRGKSPAVVSAKESFVFRAYIAQKKFSIPIEEIKTATASPGKIILSVDSIAL